MRCHTRNNHGFAHCCSSTLIRDAKFLQPVKGNWPSPVPVQFTVSVLLDFVGRENGFKNLLHGSAFGERDHASFYPWQSFAFSPFCLDFSGWYFWIFATWWRAHATRKLSNSMTMADTAALWKLSTKDLYSGPGSGRARIHIFCDQLSQCFGDKEGSKFKGWEQGRKEKEEDQNPGAESKRKEGGSKTKRRIKVLPPTPVSIWAEHPDRQRTFSKMNLAKKCSCVWSASLVWPGLNFVIWLLCPFDLIWFGLIWFDLIWLSLFDLSWFDDDHVIMYTWQ